ncbi:acyl-CoA dehydrogenase family protein, partial [Bordetella petrii]|uniref:acyl-CoA dehydrogenase family protein n=1 Tax=Bordetella petrii TaxID=94624 RepID=UPI0022A74A35
SDMDIAWRAMPMNSRTGLAQDLVDLLGRDACLAPDATRGGDAGLLRAYLWSRAETILAGTSEIQRNIIGEQVLGLPKR